MKNFGTSLKKLFSKGRCNVENKYYIPDNLLGYENAKTTKGESLGVMTGILYLAPSDLSGVDLCPKASDGCRAACLYSAGRGAFESIQRARLNKTYYFLENRVEFLAQLEREIARAEKRAALLKMRLAIRLNGTSDICWELIAPQLFERFPNVQFYDYTKIFARLKKPLPKNYDLTFSRSESNDCEAWAALNLGFRVAAVFDSIPDFLPGVELVDGDTHDIRFLNPAGSLVALKAKGRARKDLSGFVIRGVN
jgi:hypothetical protein